MSLKQYRFDVDISVPVDSEIMAAKINAVLIRAIYNSVKNLKIFNLDKKQGLKVSRVSLRQEIEEEGGK